MESFGVRSLRTLKPHWGKGLDSSLRPFGLHAREAGSHRPCPLCSSPPASLLVPSSGVQGDMQALLPGEEWGKGGAVRTLIHPARCNKIDSALLYFTHVLCVTTLNLFGGRVYYQDTQEHIHTRGICAILAKSCVSNLCSRTHMNMLASVSSSRNRELQEFL